MPLPLWHDRRNLGSDVWRETSIGNHTEQPRSRMHKFRWVKIGCSSRCFVFNFGIFSEGNFSSFLNDRFLEKILRQNSLPKLRIFDIRGRPSSQFVPLAIQSANMLVSLHSCTHWVLEKATYLFMFSKQVKNLPSIQVLRMYSWNIIDAQYEQLQSLVKSKGWNLRITRKAQIPWNVVDQRFESCSSFLPSKSTSLK